MKILIWHDKYGNHYVLSRSPEEEPRAWLCLFNMIKDAGYYDYGLEGDEKTAYEGAVKGSAGDAHWLLNMRDGCEYEGISVEYPVVPE